MRDGNEGRGKGPTPQENVLNSSLSNNAVSSHVCERSDLADSYASSSHVSERSEAPIPSAQRADSPTAKRPYKKSHRANLPQNTGQQPPHPNRPNRRRNSKPNPIKKPRRHRMLPPLAKLSQRGGSRDAPTDRDDGDWGRQPQNRRQPLLPIDHRADHSGRVGECSKYENDNQRRDIGPLTESPNP